MTKPHIHAECIKAWADGKTIQFNEGDSWSDCVNNIPAWTPSTRYRVKPEPKPDVVMYAMIEPCLDLGMAKIRAVNADITKIKSDTCMFVFDGETGKLKDAQVLAHV